MNTRTIISVALLGAALALSASAETVYDDATISRRLIYSDGFFCGDANRTERNWILTTCCNNDTNRYVRVAKETAVTNESFKLTAVDIVCRHGGADDVPFLYQCTNNAQTAARALIGILQLGGLTKESVAAASAYIASTNRISSLGSLDRNKVACALFSAAAHSSASPELTYQASSNALAFAKASRNVEYNDIGFKNGDPSYKYSKRRLSVMRALVPVCQDSDVLLNDVTNAINELVTYPEANLPD